MNGIGMMAVVVGASLAACSSEGDHAARLDNAAMQNDPAAVADLRGEAAASGANGTVDAGQPRTGAPPAPQR